MRLSYAHALIGTWRRCALSAFQQSLRAPIRHRSSASCAGRASVQHSGCACELMHPGANASLSLPPGAVGALADTRSQLDASVVEPALPATAAEPAARTPIIPARLDSTLQQHWAFTEPPLLDERLSAFRSDPVDSVRRSVSIGEPVVGQAPAGQDGGI